MERVLVVERKSHKGYDLPRQILENADIYTHYHLSGAGHLPELENFDAILLSGGAESANDNSKYIIEEIDAIQKAIADEIPILGICLGHQIVVKACGGEIVPITEKHIGFKNVSLTESAADDPVFAELPDTMPQLHLNGEMATLAPGMELLATRQGCKVGALRVHNKPVWSVQFHPEVTQDLFASWCKRDSNLRSMNQSALWDDFNNAVDRDLLNNNKNLFTSFFVEVGIL